MKKLILILLVILAGCGDDTVVENKYSDSQFYMSEWSYINQDAGAPPEGGYRKGFDVRIHFMPVEQIREMSMESWPTTYQYIWGLSVIDPVTGDCDIYVEHPGSWDDYWRMQVMGHEMMHCMGMSTHGAYNQ